ncbi:MAG: hypothetical protein H0U08_01910 [Actinobacteria bacterium]|nr:hypothetical protein [Actinomycetota bacterium]
MRLRHVLAVTAGALVVAALAGESDTAVASRSTCAAEAGNGGYTYAGHQASARGHGVRATITPTRALQVESGHVAGWVGVGGPGQGANGEDAWIQVGIASVQETEPYLYAEITRGGRYPKLIVLDDSVQVGESRNVAVLEVAGKPGSWSVWLDGKPATAPVTLRGSSGRWAPIATAESWNGGHAACNEFAFRFEQVSVAHGSGGSWRPFVSGHRFLDKGYALRALSSQNAFLASS